MLVKFFYGPYVDNCGIRHKPQRIQGAVDYLTEIGFDTEVIPIQFINVLIIEVNDQQIFRCNIKNLVFNMDQADDVVCQKLIRAVEDAARRMEGIFEPSEHLEEEEYVPRFPRRKKLAFDYSDDDLCEEELKYLARRMEEAYEEGELLEDDTKLDVFEESEPVVEEEIVKDDGRGMEGLLVGGDELDEEEIVQ